MFLLGFPTDMGTILKQMGELGVKVQVFAPNSFEGEEILKIAGEAAEGVMYVYPVLPEAAKVEDVKAAFRERYGREMNVYNGMGHGAVKLLAEAVKISIAEDGQLNTDSVRKALNQLRDFPGIPGPITFDENGDVRDRPMQARVVSHGTFVPSDRNEP